MPRVLEKVSQRGKIIIAFFAVHTVVDSDEAYILFRKQHFRIHSDLQVITPETGHILYRDQIDISGFNVSQHFLETRTIESRTTDSIIYIKFVSGNTVFFRITL